MYHVNPPDIENRVKYTITTQADAKKALRGSNV